MSIFVDGVRRARQFLPPDENDVIAVGSRDQVLLENYMDELYADVYAEQYEEHLRSQNEP